MSDALLMQRSAHSATQRTNIAYAGVPLQQNLPHHRTLKSRRQSRERQRVLRPQQSAKTAGTHRRDAGSNPLRTRMRGP